MSERISRRQFQKCLAVTAGAMVVGPAGVAQRVEPVKADDPRIAALETQVGYKLTEAQRKSVAENLTNMDRTLAQLRRMKVQETAEPSFSFHPVPRTKGRRR